jgi:hypothetical protein
MTAPVTTQHKKVKVKAYGQEHYVDERLVPLAMELWRCGIEVLGFTVDGNDGVYLDFAEEPRTFLNLVAVYDDRPGSLYQRVRGAPGVEDCWIYWIDLFDGSTLYDCEGVTVPAGRPTDFSLVLVIAFPLSDVPLLVERLSSHRPEVCAPGRGEPDQMARDGR